jgi:hypothetical protein
MSGPESTPDPAEPRPVRALEHRARQDSQMRDTVRADALMDLLFPLWQLLIGVAVALCAVVITLRLVRRGRSRMGRALLVVGVAILGVALIGILRVAAEGNGQ